MFKPMFLKRWIPRRNYVAIGAVLVGALILVSATLTLHNRFLPLKDQQAAAQKGSFLPHGIIGVNNSIDGTPLGTVSSLNLSMEIFPNALPNAYLYPKLAKSYNTSVLAFLHNPKSAGTSIKNCMDWLYRAMHKDKPIIVTADTATEEKEKLLNQVTPTNDYYMGRALLGICDSIEDRPCSYFTVVREPYERMVSEYYFCKSGVAEWLPCNKSLEEFAMAMGSLFFHELSFLVFCNEDIQNTTYPWKCNRIQFSIGPGPAQRQQRAALLDFYLANMDKIFAVIGLTEEFETSLKLFENTFGEPFHRLCTKKHSNAGTYIGFNDRDDIPADRDKIIAEAKERLMKNEEIKKRLHEDIQLYNKMYEIFQKQKMYAKI